MHSQYQDSCRSMCKTCQWMGNVSLAYYTQKSGVTFTPTPTLNALIVHMVGIMHILVYLWWMTLTKTMSHQNPTQYIHTVSSTCIWDKYLNNIACCSWYWTLINRVATNIQFCFHSIIMHSLIFKCCYVLQLWLVYREKFVSLVKVEVFKLRYATWYLLPWV